MPAPLRVVFMGTPEFALPALRALHETSDVANVVAVYTQPDRPAGRGKKITKPPVKVLAEELGLPVFQPDDINHPDERRKLADQIADVCVVVAYAQFLSPGILNLPRVGCVNIHSSLLPKYRGAAPIQYAIWKGESETGVTTMRLVSKMDAGPILLQKKIAIGAGMTASELHAALAAEGAALIIETLRGLRDGSVRETAQDESRASFAPSLKKEHGRIDWSRPGIEILRQVRAFDPWPGSFARTTRGLLKVHKAAFHEHLPGAPDDAAPGDLFLGAGSFLVRCGSGWIELLNVQPENGNSMESRSYLNGIRNDHGFNLL